MLAFVVLLVAGLNEFCEPLTFVLLAMPPVLELVFDIGLFCEGDAIGKSWESSPTPLLSKLVKMSDIFWFDFVLWFYKNSFS